MTKGQKIAIFGTTGTGVAAAAIGTTATSLDNHETTLEEDLLSEVEEKEIETEEEEVQPTYTPTPVSALTVQQANPYYYEINNWLKESDRVSINYKNTVPLAFKDLPSKYVENDDRYRYGDYINSKSFLRVSSTKNTYSSGQWSGSLSWYGSFTNMRRNRGFVTFNKAETTNNKSLRLTGVFYLLEKNHSGGWDIKYHKTVDYGDNKIIDKNNFDQVFPKPYGYTQEGKFDEVYYTNWNFISGYWDLENTCAFSSTGCGGTQTGPVNGTANYEYTGGPWYEDGGCDHWYYRKGCDKVYMWSSDYSQKRGMYGYDYMYGNSEYNLRHWIGFFYRGRWWKVS